MGAQIKNSAYRQKSVWDSDLTPLFRQAFSKKKSVMNRGERYLSQNAAFAAAKCQRTNSLKPEGRGGDVAYAEALVLGETIPLQDGFWVNSLKVDARLRFNLSAY